MQLTIFYFAGLREALACSREEVDVPDEIATVGALRAWLAARGEVWQALQNAPNLRMALNQEMCSSAAALCAGAEVAFFPPVTGG